MKKCVYDYQNSCTCAEDDKCGCTFDANMAHDFSCNFEEKNMLSNQPQPKNTPPEKQTSLHS